MAQSKLPYFRKVDLPESAKSVLNTCYGKWDYFMSSVPALDSLGKHIGWEYSDVIKGDFNDDQSIDYAVLVRTFDSLESHQGNLIVLFGQGNRFTTQVVYSGYYNSDNVLYLQEKGKTIEDFETRKYIELPVDAIESAIFEKTATTYYFKDGFFHEIGTGD